MRFLFSKIIDFLHRLRSQSVEFNLKPYQKLLARINQREPALTALDDRQLQDLSVQLRARARNGEAPERLLTEAHALVREASRRVLGMRPFDVQVLAGLAMHQGKLAEMQTGEGKTLAAVAPAYLHALTGQGVHVLTFNDYLAQRDAAWMGPLYRFLGLEVGCIQEGMSIHERQQAYAADITYGTAREAGFDFLRDRLRLEKENLVQRPFHLAIVDEADSILIDEGRVPLVIAGSSDPPALDVYRAAELIGTLQAGVDYETDTHARNVHLTAAGLDRMEQRLGCGDLHESRNLELLTSLNLALHARVLLRRNIDYIVRDRTVKLVDEFTGRVVENRRWPDGLQAALEARENLPLQPQGTILSTITLQHFLRLYPRVCGMTATAQPAAEEFEDFYGMQTVVIPPHRPCVRLDHADLVFSHKEAKERALIAEIVQVQQRGRPILVGTASVEESESLASALRAAGVVCEVLNARHEDLEAKIIAQAGSVGAVTISTNMAGRGTDIRLGGEQQEDYQRVADLGGLYVIGTNRHESRRIDDQLRGRAGRQGDPGSSRFFVCLEDDLIQRFGVLELIPEEHRPGKQDRALEDPVILQEIDRAQRIIEGESFEIRKTLRRYSALIEQQRQMIHQRRQEVLLEKAPLQLLARKAPERYAELSAVVGEDVLQRVERQLTLFHIDRCWSDHLARVAEIREGIHLFSLGGFSPLDEFHRLVSEAFRDLTNRIEEEIVASFHTAEITAEGIDLEKEGLRGPSATWSYLINDTPFGDVLSRIGRGIKRWLRGEE